MIPLLFAQLCITAFFYLGRDQSQIRIKSEVGTVKHVEALQFFFLLAQISSIVFLNVKNLALTPYCGVFVLLVVVVVGWGQDVITIQTSTMTRYRLQYHVCRPVLAGGAVVTNAFHTHNACWYMRALNNNGNEHRR